MTVVGTNPFSTHGQLIAEIGKPWFGASPNLEAADFQSLSNGVAARFNPIPAGDWYSARFILAALPKINLLGATQLRLRFNLDDNDDLSSDRIEFFSGEALLASDRPLLTITYFIP